MSRSKTLNITAHQSPKLTPPIDAVNGDARVGIDATLLSSIIAQAVAAAMSAASAPPSPPSTTAVPLPPDVDAIDELGTPAEYPVGRHVERRKDGKLVKVFESWPVKPVHRQAFVASGRRMTYRVILRCESDAGGTTDVEMGTVAPKAYSSGNHGLFGVVKGDIVTLDGNGYKLGGNVLLSLQGYSK